MKYLNVFVAALLLISSTQFLNPKNSYWEDVTTYFILSVGMTIICFFLDSDEKNKAII